MNENVNPLRFTFHLTSTVVGRGDTGTSAAALGRRSPRTGDRAPTSIIGANGLARRPPPGLCTSCFVTFL